jgi:uncharacterized protein GlcG (DUF336 family)
MGGETGMTRAHVARATQRGKGRIAGMPQGRWQESPEDGTKRRWEAYMTTITLAQAERIIDAAIERGTALNCRPLSVIVVEPGCKVKAFKKEDGSSMIRFEMAYGKAYAALSLGRSSKLVRERAQERPIFMRYLIAASGEQIFPEGGGMLIRDDNGDVIGAVGVTGDTEDRDEELAVHGIHAAGLKTDDDCAAMGRKIGLIKKNP